MRNSGVGNPWQDGQSDTEDYKDEEDKERDAEDEENERDGEDKNEGSWPRQDNKPRRERPPTSDPFESAFASVHQDDVEPLATQHSDDGGLIATSQRRVEARQLLRRPAHSMRPRFNAPAGEPSLTALRESGKEFTGFHQDPAKEAFAAHRIIRELKHAPGVPVDLSGVALSERRALNHLLWLRT